MHRDGLHGPDAGTGARDGAGEGRAEGAQEAGEVSREKTKLSPERWAATVTFVLANQPELAGVTVQAMQEGILIANDRLRDRVAAVSMGLVEAMNTRPTHKKRRHDVIIRAIKASVVFGSKWSDDMIARESEAQKE